VSVNALWFLSLFTSLCCALFATLTQQWSRAYSREVRRHGPPRKRGPVHVFLSMGVERFGLDYFDAAIVSLLHLAVLFFVAGLAINLYTINSTVFYTVAAGIALGSLVYTALSVLPLMFADCPFQTP
ncbi:hypothetical protein K488DRAFT_10511, partial [Vararia minispora EC-137]